MHVAITRLPLKKTSRGKLHITINSYSLIPLRSLNVLQSTYISDEMQKLYGTFDVVNGCLQQKSYKSNFLLFTKHFFFHSEKHNL